MEEKLYRCEECGAAVLDETLHSKYHEEMIGILTNMKEAVSNLLSICKTLKNR